MVFASEVRNRRFIRHVGVPRCSAIIQIGAPKLGDLGGVTDELSVSQTPVNAILDL